MQTLTDLLLLLSCLPTTSAKKVVSFEFHAKTSRSVTFGNSKRDYLSAELANRDRLYYITLEVGTPPQNVSVAIDTGSADLWLMEPDNPYCEGITGSNIPYANQVECLDGSFFDTADSSSWSKNSTEFSISYGDGSGAWGLYGQDDISIGDIKISNANFAVANTSNSTTAVFGIGLRNGEATVRGLLFHGIVADTYDNIPIQMKQQGLISTVAYSMYLDHVDEDAGTILFGGVDHSKYKGSLGVVPVLPALVSVGVALREPESLSVMLHGIGVRDGSGSSQSLIKCALPVLLDTGASISVLPWYFVEAIVNATDARYMGGAYAIPCGTAGSIELDFSGIKVSVLIDAMLLPYVDLEGSTTTDANGNVLCDLGLRYITNGISLSETYIIGDPILRGLYLVYDLENWEVGIANADFESDSEDIEEIIDTIPGGSSAPSYSSTSAASTYSSASRVSVYLTDFDSGITSGFQPRGGSSSTQSRSSSGSQSSRVSSSTQSRSSSGSGYRGGSSSTQSRSSSGTRSSSGVSSSSLSRCQTVTLGGTTFSCGAVRSTANFWLAGIFMLLL